MCLNAANVTNVTNEAQRLRRNATLFAALGGTLAAGPALGMITHHPALAWLTIGVQLCMIGLSFRSLAKSKRVAQGQSQDL